MGTFYLGNTQLNDIWLGNTPIKQANFTEPVPVIDGLVAFYNPKAPDGLQNNVIRDLSGNNNDLTIKGNWSIGTGNDAGSIYLPSGSTARTAGNLSTSLHGTGSVFTAVSYRKKKRTTLDFQDPTWFIGGSTLGANQKQFYEKSNKLSVLVGFGIGSSGDIFDSNRLALYQMTGSIYTTSPSYQWKPVLNASQGFAPSYPNFWSVSGFTKADQTLSYSSSGSNANLFIKNYIISALNTDKYVTGSLLTTNRGYNYNPQSFSTPGGFIYNNNVTTNVFSTNLDSSILQINPSGYAFTLDYGGGVYGYTEQWFGGMAIYNRVLSDSEIATVTNYFDKQYPIT